MPAIRRCASRFAIGLGLAVLCAAPARAQVASPPAGAGGPLAVVIRYPLAGARIGATDSTFVFGQVTGADPSDVRLEVDGVSTPVHRGGGWLAFVPLEPDSFTFRVTAEAGGRRASAERTVWVPRPAWAPGDSLGYKPNTVEPSGTLEVYAGDTLAVSVVAAPDQTVAARLGGRDTPLHAVPAGEASAGRQVWGTPGPLAGPPRAGPGAWRRYAGDVYVLLGSERDSLALVFQRPDGSRRVVRIADIEMLDPTVVHTAVLDDDPTRAGHTDGRVVARTGPGLGYELMLPNGTVAGTARLAGGARQIALADGKTAWVATGEAFADSIPRPTSVVTVVRTRVADGWSELVVPTTVRLPFSIEQSTDPVRYTLRIYGATSNTDWIRLTPSDPLVESIRWSEPVDGVYRLDVDLDADQPWGWRAYWEGTHLVLGFRHRPAALADDRYRSRLHGLTVVVDPGHGPDDGAVGPTGLRERDVNWAIADRVAGILRRRGARVVMTRPRPEDELGLYVRTRMAIDAGADLFVSIHNNALPDGVNPFVNNGTSTYFYHPQSRALALDIQKELLPRTDLPDYAVSYGNLAVTRMNEMPSVLVECAFMMLPDQEAALRTEVFQSRIAEGVVAGIERFLAERGRTPVGGPAR